MKENQSKIRKNPKRQELDKKDCWRLEDLYATDLAWEQDALKVKEQLDGFSAYQGTLGVSAENLLAVLRAQDALMLRMERLYVYASQKWHQDMGNANYQNMSDRAQALMTQVEDSASYVEPELLEIPGEKMEQFLREEPELAVYKRFIEEKLRKKDHILTKELEGVLARMELAPPRLPVYANFTARPYGEDARSLLVNQVKSPVRWQETLEALTAAGVDTFLECGPGKTLCGLVKKTVKTARVFQVQDEETLNAALEALGAR